MRSDATTHSPRDARNAACVFSRRPGETRPPSSSGNAPLPLAADARASTASSSAPISSAPSPPPAIGIGSAVDAVDAVGAEAASIWSTVRHNCWIWNNAACDGGAGGGLSTSFAHGSMIVFVVQWARSTIIIVVQWTRGKLTRAQAALRAILPLAPLASIAAAALPAPPVPAGLHHAVSLPPASPSPPASPPTAAAVASVVAAPPRAAAAAASRSAALGAFETAHAFSPSLLSLPTDMKRSTAPPLTRQRGCGHSSVQRPSSVPARSPTNLVWIEPP